jgi:DNA-binding NarL/FixJ family response regulator
MSDPVRVVVVDDHPMVRAGLRTQLERDQQILVVGEADAIDNAVTVIADTAPDVVLVDHQIRHGYGLDLLRALPDTSAAIVLVTGYEDQSLVSQYLHAGAAGYVHKTAGPVELARCVIEAAAGRPALDPGSLQRTMLAPATPEPRGVLSARERDVLAAVAEGLTNDAIGSHLGISAQTVKTHLSRIFSKLGVTDRAQAAVLATRRGLL